MYLLLSFFVFPKLNSLMLLCECGVIVFLCGLVSRLLNACSEQGNFPFPDSVIGYHGNATCVATNTSTVSRHDRILQFSSFVIALAQLAVEAIFSLPVRAEESF